MEARTLFLRPLVVLARKLFGYTGPQGWSLVEFRDPSPCRTLVSTPLLLRGRRSTSATLTLNVWHSRVDNLDLSALLQPFNCFLIRGFLSTEPTRIPPWKFHVSARQLITLINTEVMNAEGWKIIGIKLP